MAVSDRPEAETGKESREAGRSALFLAATVHAEGVSTPVRIRNLSETGARLEGPAFPPVGTGIRLVRQDVEIDAEIVWIDMPQCGVRFHGRIAVSEWIAGKRDPSRAGQARIDAIQAAARDQAPVPRADPGPVQDRTRQPDHDMRLAQEITYVQRMLEQASADLVRDPAIVHRHPEALQTFDIVDQILGHLARVMTADDKEGAIGSIGMEELRARLLRKSI